MSELATAYANAGKALLDLADAIDQAGEAVGRKATGQDAGKPPDSPAVAPSFDELPPDDWGDLEDATPKAKPSGSASVCPAHNIEYRKGRYGFYCPSTSDDPKWSNEKGYCTVTPKSAAAWLRQHA